MEGLSLFNSNLTEIQKEAVELHLDIRKNGELAASALVEFAKGLKQMRDKRLYIELNFQTFEEYVEQAVGIRQRQAYNYIQALENLGESVLQSNANLGITKLKILSEIPRPERESFLENNDVEEMSTREMKEAAAKLAQVEEQLTFATSENERLQKENAELKEECADSDNMIDEQDEEIIRLKKELKEAQERPVETAVREPSAEEIAEMTAKAVKDEQKKAAKELKAKVDQLNAEKKKAVSDAEEKAKKQIAELEEKYKATIASTEKEKADFAARLDEIEKKAKVSANPDILKFSFYFENVQKNIEAMKAIIKTVDAETAKNLKAALSAVATKLMEE